MFSMLHANNASEQGPFLRVARGTMGLPRALNQRHFIFPASQSECDMNRLTLSILTGFKWLLTECISPAGTGYDRFPRVLVA